MKTPLHQVADVLAKQTLASSFKKGQFSREVAAYLLENGRTGELNSLVRDMIRNRAESGIVEVTATSAHELSVSVRADIHTQVKKLFPKAHKIVINERIEPSLIGGVRLELIDQQLDLSVRNKLNRFKALTTAERTTA
jgi:F0F1-type ATP synthase delta subunit